MTVINNCFDHLNCFCVEVSIVKYFDIISEMCIVQLVIVPTIMTSKYCNTCSSARDINDF